MSVSRFALFTAVALGLTVPVGSAAAQDNWVPGKRFTESSTRVLGSIQKITETTKYGYVDGICFLSGFLHKGQDVKFTRDFEAGVKYAVVGGGDNGTKDLDVYILDENGNEVAKDALADNIPIVEFTPRRSARYTIRVVMYDSGPNGGFGTVGVLKVGGYEVPIRNQATALANLVSQANSVDRQVKEQVYFSSGGNQWAVFGSIIPSGSDLTINNITPGDGRRVWVTGGDTTVDDVDLYLSDSNGRLLVKDEDDDARPLLDYRTKLDQRYSVRIKNVRSRGASLILVGTLTLNP
jgi:hypothetical protein